MKWALVDGSSIVQNIISYDGVSAYQPPQGLQLLEVNDWVHIGDNKDIAQPTVQDNIDQQYTLDQRKQNVLDSLLLKRDEVIESNITVNAVSYFADNNSVNVMHQALTLEGLAIATVFPTTWILADGTTTTVTIDQIKAVAAAIATRKNAAFDNYITLAAQINASTDPESIDITTGWPS